MVHTDPCHNLANTPLPSPGRGAEFCRGLKKWRNRTPSLPPLPQARSSSPWTASAGDHLKLFRTKARRPLWALVATLRHVQPAARRELQIVVVVVVIVFKVVLRCGVIHRGREVLHSPLVVSVVAVRALVLVFLVLIILVLAEVVLAV